MCPSTLLPRSGRRSRTTRTHRVCRVTLTHSPQTMACPRDTLKEAAKTDPGNGHTHHRTGRLVRRRSNILTYSHTLLWFPLYCSCCFPVPYVVGRSRIHILINVLWSPSSVPSRIVSHSHSYIVYRALCILHPRLSASRSPLLSLSTIPGLLPDRLHFDARVQRARTHTLPALLWRHPDAPPPPFPARGAPLLHILSLSLSLFLSVSHTPPSHTLSAFSLLPITSV